MSSWTVVEFLDSQTVEAVPTKWLRDDSQCFWPPMTQSKLLVAIRNGQSPNPGWPLYQVRIFKDGTFDDYGTARKKSKKAEDTSDLNSDFDLPLKRKIIRKKIFQSESDSDSEVEQRTCSRNLPSPPKLKLDIPKSLGKASTPKLNLSRSLHKDTFRTTNELVVKKLPFTLSPYEDKDSTLGHSQSTNEQKGKQTISIHEDEDFSLDANQGNRCTGCRELHMKIDKFMGEVLKRMSTLKVNMLQIREDMQLIIEKQITVTLPDENSNFIRLFNFPLTTMEHLQEVNEYLNEEENFKNAVKQMSKLGGSDTYDFIRRCFQETISDVLSRHFTYDGTKDKNAFKSLKLVMVFLAASEEHCGANKKCAEIAIRKWLRRATERYQAKLKSSTE